MRDMIRAHSFDFLCFQETMVQSFVDSCFRQIDSNKDYLWDWSPSKRKSGGLLSGFKLDRFDVGIRFQGNYILQYNLWDKLLNRKWNILNIYGAAHDEGKNSFRDELASFCPKIKDPYLVGGDQYPKILY
jgi:hypothetical protein